MDDEFWSPDQPMPLTKLERASLQVRIVRDLLLVVILLAGVLVAARVLTEPAAPRVPAVVTPVQPCVGAPRGTLGCGA
jgi:hypothetical protein